MKIKFIKKYVAFHDFEGAFGTSTTYEVGTTKNVSTKPAQWLINNGFAEEVKESGWWKPKNGENYYFIDGDGTILYDKYKDTFYNKYRVSVGNCFKTYFAADKCRDYWEAIATVRQDEGVLTLEQAAGNRYNYYIWIHDEFGLVVHGFNADYVSVNTVLFDTREHAQTSLDNHPDEWKIIANYDWSRE